MKTSALSTALLALLLFAAPLTSHADDDAGTIMDLTFEDTPVRVVLTKIADLAGKNVIVSPKVKGNVTLKLHAVPWRNALDRVAQMTGSRVVEEDFGILRIIPVAEKRAAKAADIRAGGNLDASARERLDRVRAELAEMEARLAKARSEGNERRVASLSRRLEHERKKLAALSDHLDVSSAAWRALGANGGAPKAKPRAHTTTVTTQGKRAIVITKDDQGRIIEKREVAVDPRTGRLVLEGGVVIHFSPPKKPAAPGVPLLGDVALVGDPEIAKARKRIKDLIAAEKLLAAAGAQAEARPIQLRIREAQLALAEAEKRRAKAERARLAAKDAWGQSSRYFKSGGEGSVEGSIQALRKDVHALRGEVRELTGLVRQLLRQGGGAR